MRRALRRCVSSTSWRDLLAICPRRWSENIGRSLRGVSWRTIRVSGVQDLRNHGRNEPVARRAFSMTENGGGCRRATTLPAWPRRQQPLLRALTAAAVVARRATAIAPLPDLTRRRA